MQTSLYANRLEVAKSVSLGQNVNIHGVLHYCGYKDKTDIDAKLMREKENFYLVQLG